MAKEEEKKTAVARKSRLNNAVATMGKLPPQALDLEEAVLGALMLDPDGLIEVADLFRPEIFYQEAHQKIAGAILSLYMSSRKIDILTISHELKSTGQFEMVGGAYFIAMLTSRVVSSANIREHIKIINQKFMQRETIKIGTHSINEAYEDTTDCFDLINNTMNAFTALQEGTMETSESSFQELALQAMQDRDALGGKELEILGHSTGWKALDKLTKGLKKQELTIIAARPAMGKTAVGVNLADNLGKDGIPVGFISLEMAKMKIYARFQTKRSQIPAERIALNKLSDMERTILFEKDTELSKAPIYIEAPASLHVDQLRAKAIMMKHKYGIQVLIVDYLGLLTGEGFSEEVKIGYISRRLKQIAMELDISVVALAQLSRAVETRADKMPQLSDLRDSGKIEQDADNVWFIYRPAYYNVVQPVGFRMFNIELQPHNLLAIIVAKQREGETGNVPLEVRLGVMTVNDHPDVYPDFKVPDVTVQSTLFGEEKEGDPPF